MKNKMPLLLLFLDIAEEKILFKNNRIKWMFVVKILSNIHKIGTNTPTITLT